MTYGLKKISLPQKISYKIFVGLFSFVFPLSIFAVASPAYASVSCWGHSADYKSSTTGNYMYTASTQCSQNVSYITVTIYLQQVNWSTRQWVDVRYVAGSGLYNTNFDSFTSPNGIYVPPYYGINCRRIKTYHGVIDYSGNQQVFTTYSQGQCF